MSDRLKILNARIISDGKISEPSSILIEGKKIKWIQRGTFDAEDLRAGQSGATEVDAKGKYVSPGFIDIHVHGGGGFDFMDGDEHGFLEIAAIHAQHGTTSMLPTTLSSTFEEMVQTLEAYERANGLNDRGARFLGMHLEGPYFAMNQRGAQDPRYIRDPDPAEYREILSRFPFVKRWSAAPEKKGAIEFGRYVKSKGVLPAVAHTDAIYEEVLEAYENGFTLITHLYSAMSGVTRRNAFRYAGVIESAFIIDDMDVEIIADGVHVPAPLLKMVYKIKGPDRIALITDAMRAAGMPEGESILGSLKNGLKVIVEDGVAKLPDRTSFAGSVATADRLVRTMVKQAEIPLSQAIKMITQTPARIMGVSDQTGSIAEGMDADIVIFDDDIRVSMTICQGKIIFPLPE
jgi:N-acetylglucosamine-6-phosphate deacetylase